MLVGGVELGGGALRALDCVAEAVGQGVHGVGGVGQWREVVDAELAVVVLALKPAGELAEELGEHAGHGGEGGDDLRGVVGFGQVAGGGAAVWRFLRSLTPIETNTRVASTRASHETESIASPAVAPVLAQACQSTVAPYRSASRTANCPAMEDR